MLPGVAASPLKNPSKPATTLDLFRSITIISSSVHDKRLCDSRITMKHRTLSQRRTPEWRYQVDSSGENLYQRREVATLTSTVTKIPLDHWSVQLHRP